MARMSVRCLIQGNNFSPSKAEKIAGVIFSDMNEPGAIGNAGRYRGIAIPYGSATLESVVSDNQLDNLDALLNKLKCSIVKFREAGADDVTLHCDVFYEDQCNIEFSAAQITCLSKMEIAVTISCYKCCNQEHD